MCPGDYFGPDHDDLKLDVTWGDGSDVESIVHTSTDNTVAYALRHTFATPGDHEVYMAGGWSDEPGHSVLNNSRLLAYATEADRPVGTTPGKLKHWYQHNVTGGKYRDKLEGWQKDDDGNALSGERGAEIVTVHKFYLAGEGTFKDFTSMDNFPMFVEPLYSADPTTNIQLDDSGTINMNETFMNCGSLIGSNIWAFKSWGHRGVNKITSAARCFKNALAPVSTNYQRQFTVGQETEQTTYVNADGDTVIETTITNPGVKQWIPAAGTSSTREVFKIWGWGMANCTDFTEMFDNCGAKVIDISRWDTTGGVHFDRMFKDCSLERLKFGRNGTSGSQINMSNAETMNGMFDNCQFEQLKYFASPDHRNYNKNYPRAGHQKDFPFLDTGNVTDFDDCFKSSNFNADISGWDVSKATTFENFRDGGALIDDHTPRFVYPVADIEVVDLTGDTDAQQLTVSLNNVVRWEWRMNDQAFVQQTDETVIDLTGVVEGLNTLTLHAYNVAGQLSDIEVSFVWVLGTGGDTGSATVTYTSTSNQPACENVKMHLVHDTGNTLRDDASDFQIQPNLQAGTDTQHKLFDLPTIKIDTTSSGGYPGYYDYSTSSSLAVQTGDILPETGDFTIETWFKFSDVTNSHRIYWQYHPTRNRTTLLLFHRGNFNSAPRDGTHQGPFDGRWFQFTANNGVGSTSASNVWNIYFSFLSPKTLENDTWYHLALQRHDLTEWDLFIDGERSWGQSYNIGTNNSYGSNTGSIPTMGDADVMLLNDNNSVAHYADYRISHEAVYVPTSPTEAHPVCSSSTQAYAWNDDDVWDDSKMWMDDGTSTPDMSRTLNDTIETEAIILGSQSGQSVYDMVNAAEDRQHYWSAATNGTQVVQGTPGADLRVRVKPSGFNDSYYNNVVMMMFQQDVTLDSDLTSMTVDFEMDYSPDKNVAAGYFIKQNDTIFRYQTGTRNARGTDQVTGVEYSATSTPGDKPYGNATQLDLTSGATLTMGVWFSQAIGGPTNTTVVVHDVDFQLTPTPTDNSSNITLPVYSEHTQLSDCLVGTVSNQNVGRQVAMSTSGDMFAVASYTPAASDPVYMGGMVQVFEYVDGIIQQVGQTILGTIQRGYLGSFALCFSDSRIGLNMHTDNTGKVGVYELLNNTWTLVGQPIELNYYKGADGGCEMNRAGDRIVIGSTKGGGGSIGVVTVYEFVNNTWSQLGLNITGDQNNDQISTGGVAMNAAGDRIAIAKSRDPAPYVKAYQYDGASWVQLGQTINVVDGMTVGNNYRNINFNATGDRLVISRPYADDKKGVIEVYELVNDSWVQMGSSIVGDAAAATLSNDHLGFEPILDETGDRLISGAMWNETAGNKTGAVKVFDWNGIDWEQNGDDITGPTENSAGYGVKLAMNATGSRFVAHAMMGVDSRGSACLVAMAPQ